MSNLKKVLLGDVCDFHRGLTYKKSDEVDESENIVLRANNIDSDTSKLNLSDLRYIRNSFTIPLSKKVKQNSLLICMASGSKSHLGKVAFIDRPYGYGFGGFMGMLTPRSNIDPRYLYLILTAKPFREHINGLTDGANINNLRFDLIKRFSFPLPDSLEEQRRIAEKLEKTFAAIDIAKENSQKNLDNSQDLLGVFLGQEFSLADSQTEAIGELCDFQNGYAFESKFFSTDNGLPLIRIRDLRRGEATATKYNGEFDESFLVERGDFLIGMDGEFRCYEWKGDLALLNQRVCRLRGHKNAIEPRFLFYGINKYLKEIEDNTTFTTVKHISIKQILSIEFPLPPIDIQQKIIAKLDIVSEASKKLQLVYKKKLEILEELRHSILKQAFEGKL